MYQVLPVYIVFKHGEERHTFSLSPLELPLKHLYPFKHLEVYHSFIFPHCFGTSKIYWGKKKRKCVAKRLEKTEWRKYRGMAA